MTAAIYARVSTVEQAPENQLQELRRYVQARGWTAVEYVDHGVSGAKDRRAALDRLVADATRRQRGGPPSGGTSPAGPGPNPGRGCFSTIFTLCCGSPRELHNI